MDTLCKIRDLYHSIYLFELQLERIFNISLNEGMLLCTLKQRGNISSGDVAEALGLSCSNASKVIRSVEKKGLVSRGLGTADKRQMFFSLTDTGSSLLTKIKNSSIEIPKDLKDAIAHQ